MNIVKLGRGKGKTTELLLWLVEGHSKGIDRALIVTTSKIRTEISKRLFDLWVNNGKPEYLNNAVNRVYSVESVKKLAHRRPGVFDNCEVGVDDADEVLRFLLGINRTPSIISVTEDTQVTTEAAKPLIF